MTFYALQTRSLHLDAALLPVGGTYVAMAQIIAVQTNVLQKPVKMVHALISLNVIQDII